MQIILIGKNQLTNTREKIMTTDTAVNVHTLISLNENELKILLSALNGLDKRNENTLTNQYGSVSSLYNKLFSKQEHLNYVKI